MLKVVQDQAYRGDDWWDWSVWLEGQPIELDAVDEVVWHLHPSFSPSKVTRRNCADGFRLSTSGWGTFLMKAELRLKGGATQRLTHQLELFYPDDEEGTLLTEPQGRLDVGGYVHTLALPSAPAASRGGEGLERFDENWPLVVVARQVVEFTEAVPTSLRRAICYGLLLAQLVADKKVPDGEEAWEWFRTYADVLKNIGWTQTRQDTQIEHFADAESPLHKAVIPVLVDVLGPAAAAGSRLLTMLEQFSELDEALPWFMLLDRKSRGKRGGGFGLTLIDGRDDGGTRLISLFVGVERSQQVAAIFFLRMSKVDVAVRTVAIEATMDASIIAAASAAVAAKVWPFVHDNIRGVEPTFENSPRHKSS